MFKVNCKGDQDSLKMIGRVMKKVADLKVKAIGEQSFVYSLGIGANNCRNVEKNSLSLIHI